MQVTNQVKINLDKNKKDPKSHSLEAINSSLTAIKFPSVESSPGPQETGLNVRVDLRSSGLHRKWNIAATHDKRFQKEFKSFYSTPLKTAELVTLQ